MDNHATNSSVAVSLLVQGEHEEEKLDRGWSTMLPMVNKDTSIKYQTAVWAVQPGGVLSPYSC